jgi:FkbM family methyltransferase
LVGSATMTKQFSFIDLSFRAKLTYIAHLAKGVCKQHHVWMNFLLSKFINSDSIIFDIGGHSGQYAKLLARLAPQGKVYSFEPGSYPRSILRLSLRLNWLHNVEVVGKGLGAEPGMLSLVTPLKENGVFRFGLAHIGAQENGTLTAIEEVPMTSIDKFADEFGLKGLDFIKIDVEGWEAQILKGGRKTIRRYCPTMMIELVANQLSRTGDDLEAVWAMLLSWGYNPYVHTDDITLVPHPDPRNGDTFWVHDRLLPLKTG